jgi:hypothetical protein
VENTRRNRWIVGGLSALAGAALALALLRANWRLPRGQDSPSQEQPRQEQLQQEQLQQEQRGLELPEDLRELGLPSGFTLEDESHRRHSSTYAVRRGTLFLKVEVVRHLDAAGAETLLTEGRVSVEALYADALSPYPGDISKKIVTGKEFAPRLVEKAQGGLKYTYFLLFANDRLGYGASTPEAARYRSLLGWLYCEKAQKLYKLRMFVPAEEGERGLEELFLSLRCP